MGDIAGIKEICAGIRDRIGDADNRPKDGVISAKEMKNLVRRTAGKPGCALSEQARDVFEDVAAGRSNVPIAEVKKRLAAYERALVTAAKRQGGTLEKGSPEVMKLSGTPLSIWLSMRIVQDYDPIGNISDI